MAIHVMAPSASRWMH